MTGEHAASRLFGLRGVRATFAGTLIALAAAGCHNADTVVGPPGPTPTPTPPPAASNLAGNWSGTVRETGRTEDFFCPGGDRNVIAQVTQTGGDVVLTASSGGFCTHAGPTKLTATLSGTALSGTLASEVSGDHGCGLVGQATGTGDPHAIHLTGVMRGSCNDVNVTIDLVR